ncbi:exonuclease domain-containing protein [Clostridium paraputrificum]|uniref:exonuclease domain-containing protein n=1 Tax=Clostridium TaxID=1485 RepID=UPI003D346418
MNFVAIDFETANEKRNSACSVGITKVINSKIVEEKYWLIKPPEMRFVPQNLWIHGIYPEDVKDENTFDLIWDEIKGYIDGELVVAHNASFDMSVLRSLLTYYELEFPVLHYACTVMLAKNHMPNLKNHKLNTVASFIGHNFSHHHAGEDATACAKVMNYICKIGNINDLVSLNLKGGITLGSIFPGGYEPTSSLIKHKNKTSKAEALKLDNLNIETDYFRDRVVVFTGPLTSMKRRDAGILVENLGGIFSNTINKKTNILVTGIKNRENLSNMYKSTKLRKAEYLISQGEPIDIITEEEFLTLTLKSDC